jgi:hypothetical protein
MHDRHKKRHRDRKSSGKQRCKVEMKAPFGRLGVRSSFTSCQSTHGLYQTQICTRVCAGDEHIDLQLLIFHFCQQDPASDFSITSTGHDWERFASVSMIWGFGR